MIRDPFADEERDMDFLVAELAKFDAKLEELKLYAPTTAPAPTQVVAPAPGTPTAPVAAPAEVPEASHDL